MDGKQEYANSEQTKPEVSEGDADQDENVDFSNEENDHLSREFYDAEEEQIDLSDDSSTHEEL